MNFKLIAGLSLSVFSLSVSNVLSAEKLDTGICESNNIYKVCDTEVLNHHFVFCLLPAGCEEETTKTINVEVNTGTEIDLFSGNISTVYKMALEKLYAVSNTLSSLFGNTKLSEDGIHWTKTFITILKYCAAHKNEKVWIESMGQMILLSKGHLSLDKIAKTIEKDPQLTPMDMQHKVLSDHVPQGIIYNSFIGADNKIPF